MYEKDYPENFPEKNKKRGNRKAKFSYLKENFKKKAKQIFKIPESFIDLWSVKHTESLNCNCFLCRNPRKSFKGKNKLTLTKQEQIELEKEYE